MRARQSLMWLRPPGVAQVSIAHLGDRPSLSLPPDEFWRGTSPRKAANSRPERNSFGSGTEAASAVALISPTPGMVASRWLAYSGDAGPEARSMGVDLNGDAPQLIAPASTGSCGRAGRSRLARAAMILHELGRPVDALRSDDPELGAVAADGVDQHGPLAHQKLARPMQHQHALPLGTLDRHEPHGRPLHRLADRLGVGGVVLLAPDVGLHVGRRHQPHLVPKREFARPIVGVAQASIPTRQAEAWKNFNTSARRSFFLTTTCSRVDAVDLEDVLGEIETDRSNLHGGRLPHVNSLYNDQPIGARCRERAPSTTSNASVELSWHVGFTPHFGRMVATQELTLGSSRPEESTAGRSQIRA